MTPEQMLRAAAADLDWPSTPELAAAVIGRIEPHAAQRRRRSLRIARPLAIALAALLLLAATAAAIPGIRDPVLDWLGLRSVRVERVPRPLPAVPGAQLGLGQRTTLLGAQKGVGFRPAVASGLGEPTYYIDIGPPGGQLGLAYPRGIVITELEGRLEERFLAKFLPPGTKADALTIDGGRALWIHGAPHQYAYADRNGNIRTDSVRTAGDVLLWRRGELLIRIEGARSKAEALRIARSVRALP
jgi:hypothetical protein